MSVREAEGTEVLSGLRSETRGPEESCRTGILLHNSKSFFPSLLEPCSKCQSGTFGPMEAKAANPQNNLILHSGWSAFLVIPEGVSQGLPADPPEQFTAQKL